MTPIDWRMLNDELLRCPWFERVGERTDRDGDPLIRRAVSWNEAIRWAGAEISWWCANEAANQIRDALHNHYNREYQEWNNHITSFGSAIDGLLLGPVTASLPAEVRTKDVMDWVRSDLTGAYLECVYSHQSDVRLALDRVEWYKAGHFPCGWFVEEESAFPEHAVTVLY